MIDACWLLACCRLPTTQEDLLVVHELAEEKALEAYDDKCVGAPTLPQNSFAKSGLRQNITVTHEFRKANNTFVAAKHCDVLLSNYMKSLDGYYNESSSENMDVPIEVFVEQAVARLTSICNLTPEVALFDTK